MQEGSTPMTRFLAILSLSVALAAPLVPTYAVAQGAPASPAQQKFRDDLKAAVLNGSITIPQLKDLQANAEILKAYKAEQKPGAPVDLITPWSAVSKMKAVIAAVKSPDREKLEQDLFAMMAAKQAESASTDTATDPGKKLGKDIFGAVMRGKPTEPQVKSLQDSLNQLQSVKTSGERPMQKLMALKQAKSGIEQTMNAGDFRPQDRQAVLDDLNNLGGGGGGLRRNRS
jgi:hypothetical protein